MGFALTIIYIAATIISPDQFGKEWASYHALTYLAGITVLASLPSMSDYGYWRSSVQTFLLIGLLPRLLYRTWPTDGSAESWKVGVCSCQARRSFSLLS